MDLPLLLKTVLAASWQGSLSIFLLLLLRPFLGSRIPARWRSTLWTLVLVRLLVPAVIFPRSPASLENLSLARRPVERMEIAFDRTRADLPFNPARSPDARPSLSEVPASARLTLKTAKIEPWKIAAAFWLFGTGLVTAWLLGGAFRLQSRLLRDRSLVEDNILRIWQSCCERVSVRLAPRLFATSAITSPALGGLFRPSLLLPRKNLATLSPEDLEHIFLHELAHFQRRDHWIHFLQLGALCIHWFNPLLWFSFRYLRADRELAADEWALRHLSSDSCTAYGDTLLRLVRSCDTPSTSFFPRSAIGILEDGAQIRQRLLRIVAFRPHRLLGTLAGAGVVLIMAALVLGQAEKPPVPTDDQPVVAATPEPDQSSAEKDNPVEVDRLQKALLAAARQGNRQEIWQLIRLAKLPRNMASETIGKTLLDQLANNREIVAFQTLLTELRKSAYGMDWQPDDAILLALARDARKDFIDVMLASWLEPDRVAKLKTGNQEMEAWLVDRASAIRKQRADQDALVKAAGENELASMRRLLDAGIDINCTASSHHTPLTWAADKNKVEAVRLLLERGANVDQPKYPGWDYTPLCLTRSVEIADLLKAHGADVQAKLYSRNTSILTYIARFGGPDMVQWMIDQGVDPKAIGDNGQNLLFDAGDEKTISILLKAGLDINAVDEFGQTPMRSALTSTENPAEVVTAFLKHGADPNRKDKNGNTPLMSAPDGPTVDALVAAGADINAINDQGMDILSTSWNAKPSRREALLKHGAKLTPSNGAEMLANAIHQSDEAEVKSLLALGVNPAGSTAWDGRPSGSVLSVAILVGQFKIAALLRTAGANDVGLLSEAAAQGDLAKMKQLLDAGADVNERCEIGRVPLHYAVRQRQSAAVALLLERGAKVDLFDATGNTAYDWAQEALFSAENTNNFVEGDRETNRKVCSEIVNLMASKRPNPNYRDEKGETALMRCAQYGGIYFGKIPENLDINAQRPDGMTALMLAVATQPKDARFISSTVKEGQKLEFSARGILVRELLKRNADLTLRNQTGETALDLAKKVGNPELLKMLEAKIKS